MAPFIRSWRDALLWVLGCTAAALLSVAVDGFAAPQQPSAAPPQLKMSSPGFGSTTVPVSPSAHATIMTSREADGTESVAAIVIWRGRPGWFMGPEPSRMWGGGSGSIQIHRFSGGGHEFEVVFNRDARTLQVLDSVLDLRTGNVVFVDNVGASSGAWIAGTSMVDGRLDPSGPPAPAQMLQVLGRSREILDYLRCEVPLPDPVPAYADRMFPLCTALAGR